MEKRTALRKLSYKVGPLAIPGETVDSFLGRR
jgi:hypothetical protein